MHGIFYGGASRSLIQLLKLFNHNQKFEFLIYTTSISSVEVKKEIEKYCKTIRKIELKIITANQASTSSYKTFIKSKNVGINNFIKLLIDDEIEILHINTTVFSHILEPIKKTTQIKLLVHIRELIPKYGKSPIGDFILDQIKTYSDFIICISSNEAERFDDFKNKIILPNTIDFEEIDSTTNGFRKQYGIDNDTVLVTMSSHFYKPKGHLLFLDSLIELVNTYKKRNVLFIIVGFKSNFYFIRKLIKNILFMPDYLNEIRIKIKENNLKDFVKLIPYTYNVLPIIKESDIIVRPALTMDPWGRDIIEGMAMAKPIIATGSSTFFVTPGVTGYLVECDPREMAQKINELIDDKLKRILFGLNGRNRIKEICDPNKYFQSISFIYEELSK